MNTLRARLTAWYIAIITIALGLFAALLYAWLSRTLYSHHDPELLDDATRLTQAISTSEAPLTVLAALDAAERVGPLVMVRDSSGATLFRSARLASSDPLIGEHTALQHAAMRGPRVPEFFTVGLEHGSPVRFICLPLSKPAGTYLQLGRRLGDVDLLLRVVLIASLSLIPVVVILTSAGGLFMARRALHPIADIATTLESIQATDLSRRVATETSDEEIRRVGGSINHLIDRLQRAFESLTEFSADVSHQLRTPLTVIKSSVDVTLSTPRSTQEYEQTLRDISDEIDALSATVDDIRAFSLAEADSTGRERALIDVTAVFREASDVICVLAAEREIHCEVAAAEGVVGWGNRIQLRQMLLNIGENAVRFTPAGGHIRMSLDGGPGSATILISDSGRGVPPDVLPHIFQRRYHADRRTGSRGGSGLGLALAKRIVDAHGGSIELRAREGRGTIVRITVPIVG